MSSRRTDTPSREYEDEDTASSSSSSDHDEQTDPPTDQEIYALITEVVEQNQGDFRAVNWDAIAVAVSPSFGFSITGAECRRRFGKLVDKAYPPNQPAAGAQATASAGANSSGTSTNAATGAASGSQAEQIPANAGPRIQNAPHGSSHATSAADPRAAASSVLNSHTDTEGEGESDADSEAST